MSGYQLFACYFFLFISTYIVLGTFCVKAFYHPDLDRELENRTTQLLNTSIWRYADGSLPKFYFATNVILNFQILNKKIGEYLVQFNELIPVNRSNCCNGIDVDC